MLRILIGDEYAVVRRGLRALLEERPDWRVCGEAETGRALLQRALELQPDLVVLELMLRELNGVEVARRLRQDLPTTEVLAFTVADPEELAAAALEAGVRGYVIKSEPAEELVRAVDALSHHRPYFDRRVTQAMREERRGGTTLRATGRFSPLTQREREVIQMVAEGRRTREIAWLLGISPKTVETHRTAIMRKLHLESLADVVRYAVRNNIVHV